MSLRSLKSLACASALIVVGLLFGAVRPAAAADQVYFSAVDDVAAQLVQRINAETVRIDMSAWYLTDSTVYAALLNRFKAGVPVRLIGDRGSIFEIDQYTKNTFYYLASQGVPIRLRYNPTWYPEIDHWKATIFVGQNVVAFGSANYTPFELTPFSATNYKDEVTLFTGDPAIVGAFKTKFDRYWNDTAPEPESLVPSAPYFKNWDDACASESACSDYRTQYPNPVPMVINTARLEPDNPLPSDIVWGQGSSFNNRLTSEINAESTAIDFIIYRLTVDNITQALLARRAAGVPIRLIIEPSEYLNRKWPEFWITHANLDALWASGISMKMRTHQGLTHMKVLITSSIATIASSNYAAAWQRDHNYFMPAAGKPAIYAAVKNRFQAMWDNTTDFADFQPQPPDAPTISSPAPGATAVPTTTSLTWNRAVFATNYDVYLGTNGGNLTLVGNVPAQLVNDPPDTYSFTPGTPLAGSTTYYWKVVARTNATPRDPSMIASSSLQSFTTAASGPPSPIPSPWQTQDVGAVGVTGSASYSGGVFSVAGGGADIWGTADAFRYVYQSINGDAEIVARVTGVQNTNAYAKAGVMLRESLAAGARHVILDVRPDGSVEFMARASTNGATSYLGGGSQPAPSWLKLTRTGNTVTASVSANGAAWTTVGSTTTAMSASASLGLIVNSHNAGSLNTSTFDNVSVTSGPPPAPGAPASPAPANGATGVSTTPTLTWSATGATTYDVKFGTTNPPSQVSTAQSAASYTPATLAYGVTYFWQIVATNSGGSTPGPIWSFTTASTPPPPPGTPTSPSPASGATAVSTTPTLTWSASGTATYDVKFGTTNPPPQVSTAQTAASYAPGTLAASTVYFWQIVATNGGGSTPGPVWSFTTGTAPGALPSPWTHQDVGSTGLAGSATYSSASFTVRGAGADIWGSADAFHYVSQPTSGDAELVARVTSTTNTNPYAKAGLMLRESFAAGARHVILDVRPDGSVEFMTRTATSGATSYLAGGTQAFPTWLKLARTGGTVVGSVSANGTNWTVVGSTTTSMGASANIGLIVTSHDVNALNTSLFDNVTVTLPAATPPATPASPSPANGATNVSSAGQTLTWTAAGATSYTVKFGTTNPPAQVSTGQASASYATGALATGTTYFWQIVAANGAGNTSGPVWSFTTTSTPPPAPGTPASPSPANGATAVSTTPTLTWTSANAATYDVKFGTTNPPSQVSTAQTAASYTPATLAYSTTYFWQVVATNGTGSTAGPVWSFTTAAAPPPPPGNVVIYASDIPAGNRHGSWSPSSDATAAGGVKLGTPDNGVANTNNPLASPTDYVDVTFTAAANTPYTIWLRLKALANSKYNDAVWVQFSDALASGSPVYPLNSTSGLLVNLADSSSGSSLNNWGWQNTAYWLSQATTVTFASSGSHTLRIQVREDGVQFDQIVLSPTNYLNAAPGPVTNDSTIVAKP